MLTLLVCIGSGLAFANGNLGAILGTITINVQNETRVVDVGNETVLVEPVLVMGILRNQGRYIQRLVEVLSHTKTTRQLKNILRICTFPDLRCH